jgi:chloride channel protein, CIC family
MDEALVIDNSPEQKVIGIITSSDVVLTYNRKLSELNYGDQDDKQVTPSDGSVLRALNLNSLVEKDLATIKPEASLRNIVDVIIKSKRNIFPVVDEEQKLHGIILLNDIRSTMFDTSKYDELKASDLMTQPPDFVSDDDPMQRVISKFEMSGAWNLPVINKNKEYIGLVSKSSIFSRYRSELMRHAIY